MKRHHLKLSLISLRFECFELAVCSVGSTVPKFSSRGVFEADMSCDGWGDGSRRAKWIYPSFILYNWATAVVYLKPKHTRAGARRECLGSLSK